MNLTARNKKFVPQVGIGLRMALVYVPPPSLIASPVTGRQAVEMYVIINPEYEAVCEGEGKVEDFEGCYSVGRVGGVVARLPRIRVTYYSMEVTQVLWLT